MSQNAVLRQCNKANSAQTKECLLQVMVLSLTEFIKQLTPVNQNEISTAIVNNYNHNKMKLKLKCALNLFKKYNVNSKRKAFNKLKVVSSKKDTYDYGYDYDNYNKFNNNNNNIQQRSNKLSYKKPRYDNNNNNNNIETYSPHKVSLSNYHLDSFLTRQERFSQRLKEKKDQHTSKIEEEMRLLYTFSPKVNNYPLHTVNKSNNFISINDMNYSNHHDMMISNYNDKGERERKQSAFDRLYKEGTSRIKERNLKDKEGYRSGNESKKVVSKASINKMHKKYVDYEKKKKMLQKTFDEEMGITFKPKSFTVGSGYVVDSNFEDRNKKLIEDRNNFIFVYDYLRRSKFNEKVVGGSNDSKLLKEYLQKNNVEIESLMNKYADAAERFAREYNTTTMNNNENGAVLSEDDENEEN